MLLAEQQRSEDLLHNVLPKAVATRLKQSPGTIADRFTGVTILFADMSDFTTLAATRSPEETVTLLNVVFPTFDCVAEERGVEKIKTIGDAHMAVAGLPEPRPDHAEAIADMALAMQAGLSRINRESGESLGMRVGIHTGSVVAGVIGTRKLGYDLWGDSVNTASRMESHGLRNHIQIRRTRTASWRTGRVPRARPAGHPGKGTDAGLLPARQKKRQ